MYIHDYDFTYNPSAPVVELGIGLKRGETLLSIVALVDSGADATLIPATYLRQIGAIPSDEKWLQSVVGERQIVELYPVALQIGNFAMYTSVVGDEYGSEAMIGRNVLNHYRVILDGPATVVEISQ